jgi:hypothetical protein
VRALPGDEQGVQDVIGFILVFGILSVILVLTMLAFNVAQGAAKSRAVELRAESAATRIAGVIVQSAIAAEQQGSGLVVAYRIDLPPDLEGFNYTVYLEPAGASGSHCTTGSYPDQVCITIPGVRQKVTEPVFSAGQSTNVKLCASRSAGGDVRVRFDAKPVGCSVSTSTALFLEAA